MCSSTVHMFHLVSEVEFEACIGSKNMHDDMAAPFMIDKSILALERLITQWAVQLVRNAGRLLLFFRAILGCLVDPVSFLYLQSPLQPFLPLLFSPAQSTVLPARQISAKLDRDIRCVPRSKCCAA